MPKTTEFRHPLLDSGIMSRMKIILSSPIGIRHKSGHQIQVVSESGFNGEVFSHIIAIRDETKQWFRICPITFETIQEAWNAIKETGFELSDTEVAQVFGKIAVASGLAKRVSTNGSDCII